MDNKELINAIDKFIESDFYHYALMINGDWGTGKTFFIQNSLIPHLETIGKNTLYISLYGKTDTTSISEEIAIEAIKDKFGILKNAKAVKGVGIAFRLAWPAISEKYSLNIGELPNANELKDFFPNFDVIVFDDLERCSCDINEIMGYINEYVEHSDTKIIVVANESEIGKWQLDNNRELQLLLAANKDIEISLPKTREEETRERIGTDIQQKSVITKDLLERRRQTLFNSNERYKRIKEKVIGQTIKYTPDIEGIFIQLLEKDGLDPILKNYCESLITRFVIILNREEHMNIRAIQFFLQKANFIIDSLNDADKERLDPLFESIIMYTFRSCVRYMKGGVLPEWTQDYGIQPFEQYSMQADAYLMGFRFIDDLIAHEIFDQEYVVAVLNEYLTKVEEEGKLSDDPVQKLDKWWQSEDSDVRKWLLELSQNIKDGRYTTALFPNIIKTLGALKSYGLFTDEVDSAIDEMKKYASSSDVSKLSPISREQLFITNENSARITTTILDEVKNILDERLKNTEKDAYEEILSHDNWGELLEQDIAKNKYTRRKSFISCMDPNVLIDKLIASDNVQINCFRSALGVLYQYSDSTLCDDDLNNLNQIKELLESKTIEGDIRSWLLSLLHNDIERYIKEIKDTEL